MEVSTDVADWCTLEDGTRMTCVNSFGFGGTNSHAIIKQLAAEGVQETREEDGRKYIVFLSALDNGGLANSLYHFAPTPQKTKIIFGGFRPGGLTSEIVFICTSAFFNSSTLPSATNATLYLKCSRLQELVYAILCKLSIDVSRKH
jgi:hypothetical protein